MLKIDIILNTEEVNAGYGNEHDLSLILHDVVAYVSDHKVPDFEIDANIGDPIVALIEHYSDGDTFGSHESMDVKGVFKTLDEAEKFSKTIDKANGYFTDHIDFLFETAIIKDRNML